jgi:hypothetical protein
MKLKNFFERNLSDRARAARGTTPANDAPLMWSRTEDQTLRANDDPGMTIADELA